jgi:hypothetical protein
MRLAHCEYLDILGFGQPYMNVSYDTIGNNVRSPFTTLNFESYNEDNGALLAGNSVPVNSTGALFGFSFSSFTPRFESSKSPSTELLPTTNSHLLELLKSMSSHRVLMEVR